MNTLYVLHLGHAILGVYSTREKAEQESKKFSPNLSIPVGIERVTLDRPA